MFTVSFRNTAAAITGGAVLLTLSLAGIVQAEDDTPQTINISAADIAAVKQATHAVFHAKPSSTLVGRTASKDRLSAKSLASHTPKSAISSASAETRYEGDLGFEGGPVVESAKSHPIYLLPGGNCPVSVCWGNPPEFLKNLSTSQFIHLADQYIGLTGDDRYQLGASFKYSYTPPTTPLTDANMQTVVHAAALAGGINGYHHIFHVFLPPGQDECFDSTFTTCYSPDNSSTFFFCAYHGSVTFSDVGHVLYTVEPYQNVQGCQVGTDTPNGQLVDSTNDVLAHETFETITDPDIDAWRNLTSNALFLSEIGDECQFIIFVGNNVYFDPDVFQMNGKLFATQPMYSNEAHGCAVH